MAITQPDAAAEYEQDEWLYDGIWEGRRGPNNLEEDTFQMITGQEFRERSDLAVSHAPPPSLFPGGFLIYVQAIGTV